MPYVTKSQAESIRDLLLYVYRIGRCDGSRSDKCPDHLLPMLRGTFPECDWLLYPFDDYSEDDD